MYKEFFGLRANPFNVNPDPRYLFLTRHTEEALACLTYGIQSRKGFVLLTGEVGTGKTTLINKLLEWLRAQQVPTAFIFNSRLKRVPVPRLHDGGLRHSLRHPFQEPDPAASLQLAAGALSGGGDGGAHRGRGPEPWRRGAGRNSHDDQSRDLHGKASCRLCWSGRPNWKPSLSSPTCASCGSA